MANWEYILFDLECNGFKPTKIWCICMTDLITRENRSFVGPAAIAEAIILLQDAKTFDRDKILDTLYLSKALVKMDDHKLESWGEILGVPKLPTPFSFYRYDARMVPYCERDVELNVQVFLALWSLLEQRHGDKVPPKWQILREFKNALPVPPPPLVGRLVISLSHSAPRSSSVSSGRPAIL
jgi:hypothetical protein